MVRHERNVCLLTSDQDPDNDLELSTEGNESPYSITDLFRSYVGKSSDVLNNNIYSSFDDDGSDDAVECDDKDGSSLTSDRDLNVGSHPKGGDLSESTSLRIDEDGSNSALQESSNASSSASSRRSPWEQTDAWDETSEKICNDPPGMLQLRRLLEVRGWARERGSSGVCVFLLFF